MQRILLAAFLGVMFFGGNAKAHPHVFVDADAAFTFADDGRLKALKVTWTYDAFTTLLLFNVLDLDRDGDGKLNDTDRAAIVKGETEWPAEYKGDVHLDVAGEDWPLARPANGTARLVDDRIMLTFDMPLAKPLDLSGKTAVLRFYDPVYYYSYAVLAEKQQSHPLRDQCDVEIIPFTVDDAVAALQARLAALSREETPEEENVGRLFSDEVRLTCR